MAIEQVNVMHCTPETCYRVRHKGKVVAGLFYSRESAQAWIDSNS